jgi:hypothetical protein
MLVNKLATKPLASDKNMLEGDGCDTLSRKFLHKWCLDPGATEDSQTTPFHPGLAAKKQNLERDIRAVGAVRTGRLLFAFLLER